MPKLVPRLALGDLEDRLRTTPVVVVGGVRQSGKTTLVRDLADNQRRYVSLDDPDVLEMAHSNPLALLRGPGAPHSWGYGATPIIGN